MSEVGLDCGDNSCEFAPKRGGMRTNGGCRCLDGLSVEQRRKVRAVIRAARVEIERLLDAEHKANGIAMKERESADRFAKLWHDDVKAAETDRDRKLDAISDALHRAGVGDSPRLVDRIALAGEELHKLRRAAQERDELRTERDSLRQQLEAARRDSDTYARDHRDSVEDEAKLAADLAAVQQRIAELENDLMATQILAGANDRRAIRNAAALRAIAPVYRAAAADSDQNASCTCAVCCAVRAARARLTPELLAVVEAVGK